MTNTQLTIAEIKLPEELIFQSMTNVGYDYFVQQQVTPFIVERKSLVSDLKTATGRAKTIKVASEVTKQKTAMTKAVIAFAKDLETKPKEIRANMKKLEELLDTAAAEIRQPVTDFEEPRKAGIEQLKSSVVFDGFKPTSAQVQERIDWLSAIEQDKTFYADFYSDATKTKANSLEVLNALLTATLAEEKAADEQAETLAKAERAQWVNAIAVIGYNLTGLPLHQLLARIDQLNSFVIEKGVYVEQFDNAINALATALNALNAAIDALKEADAKTKREGELCNLKNMPDEAKGWTPDGILEKLGKLKAFNYKADYWKELYGDVVDTKQAVIAQLESLHAEKVAATAKAIEDAKAEAEAKAEQARIKALQDAEIAQAKAVQDAKDKAEREAKALADAKQAEIQAEEREAARLAADEQHIEQIKRVAIEAIFREIDFSELVASDIAGDIAVLVVNAIQAGKIQHVKIQF